MIYQPISKEKTNQIDILCNDDQSDQHTCHKLYSACCTWRPASTSFSYDTSFLYHEYCKK